ncbi:hypothetical protein KTJ54_17515 [Acinetobacter radioresistens]|uniref:hypothetical protein n=1 Tax=Acinetobacter radioresistens TaxID=40216 RepID=UPI0021D074CD|nr:hypothetical protein [Acinetobacter radioresistens]MCU4623875.1 hypothetical protein [Acinetobacter radioresistens]
MRVSGFDSLNSIEVNDGVELPKFIRTLTVETAEEEQQLRLFLTGALKMDEHGGHALVGNIGSRSLAINPDVSNGKYALETNLDSSDRSVPLGNDSSKGAELKFDYTLVDTLQIIDTLAAVVSIGGSSDAIVTASEKLNLLIQTL